MREAYIIYYDEEAKKNSGFIEMLKTECVKYDIELKYISFEEVSDMSEDDFRKRFMDALFVINRTREYSLSQQFEKINIYVFHSSKITELGNDKYKTYCYLKEYFEKRGCPLGNINDLLADTIFVKADSLSQAIDKYIGKDYVIKSVDGHGGSQVFLLKVFESLKREDIDDEIYREKNIINEEAHKKHIYEKLKGHDCIIQKHIDSDSNDIRVYVLFGKIYAAVLRHGNDSFKSNFSLGGSVSEYFPDKEQEKFIEAFIEAFGKDELKMAGIDFILTRDGRFVFNELEEMVGSRMLYNCSKHDIVKEYIEHIARFCRKEVTG